jgi:hypothetical protein
MLMRLVLFKHRSEEAFMGRMDRRKYVRLL